MQLGFPGPPACIDAKSPLDPSPSPHSLLLHLSRTSPLDSLPRPSVWTLRTTRAGSTSKPGTSQQMLLPMAVTKARICCWTSPTASSSLGHCWRGANPLSQGGVMLCSHGNSVGALTHRLTSRVRGQRGGYEEGLACTGFERKPQTTLVAKLPNYVHVAARVSLESYSLRKFQT